MLRVKDVMTADVLTVTPETTLREAMELLAMRHVSGAPVIAGEKLVGVVTSADLMALASALPGVPEQRPQGPSWEEVEEVALEDEVEAEDEPASAFFSELWDDVGVDAATRMGSVEGPEWNALEAHDVGEVMTTGPLVTISPEASVEAAAELMLKHGIHRVLVTDDGHLAGILSAIDVAGAAADHRLTRRTYVFNRDDYRREAED